MAVVRTIPSVPSVFTNFSVGQSSTVSPLSPTPPGSFCEKALLPPLISSWILDLFSEGALIPQNLIKKEDVHETLLTAVERMQEEAMSYLRSHPLHEFDTSILDTHYLVSKNAYRQVTTALTPKPTYGVTRSSSIEVFDDHSFTQESTQDAFELSLGYNDYSFDEETLAIQQRLHDEGVRSESAFVAYFNEHVSARIDLVKVATLRCETLYRQIYVNHLKRREIRASQVPSAREGLIALFSCEDPDVKNHALKRLIDVLQADPIAKESYMNLPKQIIALVEQIGLESSQNLDDNILAQLIEAYALTVNNIWLHSERDGSASIIQDSVKHKIWEHAELFEKQNIKKSPIIKFWIDFSIQAANRLRTEVSRREETLRRVFHIGKAIITLATMIGGSIAKEELDISQEGVESIIADLTAAFYHIGSREEWFEPLLAFKYMCHFVRYCPSSTSQLVEMALRYKTTEQDPNLFLGIVSSLESLLLHTTHPETTEACLKALMTLIFFDNALIQERIVRALLTMKTTARPTLSIACEALLNLIYQSRNDLRKIFPSDFLLSRASLPERFKVLIQPGQTLCMHVMAIFIRFTVDIKTETGVSSESLLGQLTRSTTGDLDGDGTGRVEDMMQALKDILPNPLTPDADGNGILHLCVRRGNGELISTAMRVFSKASATRTSPVIDPNAINHDGRTPLMLCVEPGAPPFLEGIEILAKIKGVNPNVKDKFGRTFLHYLVEMASAEEIQYVLSRIEWAIPLSIDDRDAGGLTPFMLCMRKDTPESLSKAKILLEAKANIHIPDPCNITGLEMAIKCSDPLVIRRIPTRNLIGSNPEYTCFMMAAEAGKDETLDYLFRVLPNHTFTRAEVLAILKGALSYATGLGAEDKMLAVVHKHMASHTHFRSSCIEALPGLSWSFEEGTGVVRFEFEGHHIPTEEIQSAVRGGHLSEAAARAFGMNPVMVKCLKESGASIQDVVREIRSNPRHLYTTNILGRNALQLSLLESLPEIKSTLLCYEHQNFANEDHQGNQPLHYAAAILDRAAYRRILSKVGNTNGTPQNHLGLTPLVMALQLPIKMLPEPTSSNQPYPHLAEGNIYSEEDHDNFCGILEDTLTWYRAKKLLSHDPLAKANPYNYKSNFGWNLLHYAAVYGTPSQAYEVARWLPELFFDVHRSGGRLPIQQALFRNRLDVAEALIRGWIQQEEAAGNTKALATLSGQLGCHGISLWSILAETGAVELMKELDSQVLFNFEEPVGTSKFRFGIGKDIHQFYIGSPPFAVGVQTALRKNDLPMLAYFAERAPTALLDLQDDTRTTPLMLACRLRRTECIELLLNLARDHNRLEPYLQACNMSGQAPIHILCCTPRLSALDQIISAQYCTLHEAQAILDGELQDCFSLLLAAGANLSHRDDGGNTPLHLICGHNHAQLIDLVCQSSEKISELTRLFNALNDDKRTPIFSAVANACMETFRKIIEIKERGRIDIKLDIKDINGFTLLHISAQEGQEGQIEILQKLIRLGARLSAVDGKGETVIHKAAFNRRLRILRYLITLAKASPMQSELMAADLSQMNALHKAVLLPPELYRRSLRRHYEQRMITGSCLMTPEARSHLSPMDEPLTPLFGNLTAQALAMEFRVSSPSTALVAHSFSNTCDHFDPDQIKLINDVITELLDWGLSMETEEQLGYSVWHYLMRGPYDQVLSTVLRYYEQRRRLPNFSNLKSHAGETLAHLAAKFGQKPQLLMILPYMSRASLNLKTREGFTAASLALFNDHLDCLRCLIDTDCRLNQTTRAPTHPADTPKGDNLLHQIVQKPHINVVLEGLFMEISQKEPILLSEKNASDRTVLEELTDHGHIGLLPLTVARMPDNDSSRAAIRRAHDLTHARLGPGSPHMHHIRVGSELESQVRQIQTILGYASMNTYLGIALTRWPKLTVKTNVILPTVEELYEKARAVQASVDSA